MVPRIRRKELAAYLGVCTRTLDRWTKAGIYGARLRSQKFGRTVSFSWSDIEAFRRVIAQRSGKNFRPEWKGEAQEDCNKSPQS